MATDPTNTSNGKPPASKNVVDETWNTDSEQGRKLPENAHDFELTESNGSAEGHLANAHMGSREDDAIDGTVNGDESTGANTARPAGVENGRGHQDPNW